VKDLPISSFPAHAGRVLSSVAASIEIAEPAIAVISHLDGRPLDAEGIAVLGNGLQEKCSGETLSGRSGEGINRFVEIDRLMPSSSFAG
jgi:hypothetical protein